MHAIIPLTQVDIWGMVFSVCCMLSNYGPPMIRDGIEGLPCVAEIQWGVKNEVGAGVTLPCTAEQAAEIAAAHREATAMSGRAAVASANAAAIASGAQDARLMQAAAALRGDTASSGGSGGGSADSGGGGRGNSWAQRVIAAGLVVDDDY